MWISTMAVRRAVLGRPREQELRLEELSDLLSGGRLPLSP